MKRILCLLLAYLLLYGCAAAEEKPEKKIYEATFLTLFDTVTVIKGAAESKDVFAEVARNIHDELEVYHQLFDIYNSYDGIQNLKVINDNAGIAPVKVDQKIIDLLLDCKKYYDLSGGTVNVALGGVLQLWHEARSNGINDPVHAALPDDQKLHDAALHSDLAAVVIDETESTVYISDPAVRLDVGAVAKGWSVQRVAENAPSGLLISVGGNVCSTGPKDEAGTPWVIGVQNPDGADYLHTIYVSGTSVVTSGDYQRYYTVDGKRYHHIIDPQTLYPSVLWRSVTIVLNDSGLADALSTALFVLPLEEGERLLEKCGAEAMWVDTDGNQFYSAGFDALIRT